MFGRHQNWIKPLAISHGYSRRSSLFSRFQLEFGWTGTRDCSAWFTLPTLLSFFDDLGGWGAVQKSNAHRAARLRKKIEEILEVEPLGPDFMFSHMGSVLVPHRISTSKDHIIPEGEHLDSLWMEFFERYGIEVVVSHFKNKRIMRFSMHVHVREDDERRLIQACRDLSQRSGS